MDQTTNQILRSLLPGDFALLTASMKRVELPVRQRLENRGRAIEHVYFLESGLASVVALAGIDNAEISIVGHEGMSGIPIILQETQAVHETFIQVAGTGWRIDASTLAEALDKSATLRVRLLRYALTSHIQIGSTAIANARFSADERLARWLLMAQDRIQGPIVPLTHDFLALMLGVRRPGVTTALAALKTSKAIDMKRGEVEVLDRDMLLAAAGSCYGNAEAEYNRIMKIELA